MKKTKLLSMLTAGAVVATTVTTFSVWDTLTAEKSGTIAVDAGSTELTATADTLNFGTGTKNTDTIVYESEFDLSLKNHDKVASITLTPKVHATGDETTIIDSSLYELTITQNTGTLIGSGPYTDEEAEATNTYKVTLTAKKNVNGETLDGKSIDVDIAAKAVLK